METPHAIQLVIGIEMDSVQRSGTGLHEVSWLMQDRDSNDAMVVLLFAGC